MPTRPAFFITLTAGVLASCDAGKASQPGGADCEGAPILSLTVGEHSVLDPTASAGCIRLAPEGAEYIVAAVSAAGAETATGVTGRYTLQGGDDGAATASLHSRPASLGPVDPSQGFDLRLRERERAIASNPAFHPVRQPHIQAASKPTVGDKRTFKVCGVSDCTGFVDVLATAVYVGSHAAVFLDDTVPAGGYTQAEIDSAGNLFDNYLYPIDTTAFGRESDADNNGVVMILLSDQVNRLTTTCGVYVTGYFFGLDLMDDPNSNRGEVFYAMVPNPSGTGCTVPNTFTRRTLAPTLIHEFQHMISYNRHRLLAGGEAENTWLNEGLSVFAEELGGRQIPGAQCVGGQANSCLTQFIKGDLERAYEYLLNPEASYLVEPGTSSGTLAERGANWLFVRWLADRSTSDSILGTDITRALSGADNPTGVAVTGGANVTAAARSRFDPAADFGVLAGEWQLANCLEGMPAVSDEEPTGRLRYKSWNLPAAFSGLVLGPYPLNPHSVSAVPFSLFGQLRAGSGPHLHILPTATTNILDVSFSTTNASAVKPRVAVARIQ
ncbi:MAG TPA: hypothetical protein VH438_15615 [Gemmatimonadales bacterium]